MTRPCGHSLDGDCDECAPECPDCARAALKDVVLRERVTALALWAQQQARSGRANAEDVDAMVAGLQPDAVAAEVARRLAHTPAARALERTAMDDLDDAVAEQLAHGIPGEKETR